MLNDATLPPPDQDDVLIGDEAAGRLLGVSARTVRAYRAQGKLACVVGITGAWRYRRGTLRAMIRERERRLR